MPAKTPFFQASPSSRISDIKQTRYAAAAAGCWLDFNKGGAVEDFVQEAMPEDAVGWPLRAADPAVAEAFEA